MDQNSKTARESSDRNAAMHIARLPADRRNPFLNQYHDERGDARESKYPSIGERLQVIVVRLLDAELAIPGIVSSERDAERIEAHIFDSMGCSARPDPASAPLCAL